MIFSIGDDIKFRSGIYAIRSKLDKRLYVGSAVNLYKRYLGHKLRLNKKLHHSAHLQSFVNKHGIENLSFDLIELVENANELVEKEQFWINKLDPLGREKGFNTCAVAGSKLGIKQTDLEVKNKSGVNNPHYGKRGIEAPAFGHRHSEETKKKIAEAAKRSRTGIKLSDETKEKLRLINLGKKIPKEVTKNWGERLLGGKNHNAKKVINTETNEVYNCVRDAAENNNLTYSKLRKIMCGERKNNTKLMYVND